MLFNVLIVDDEELVRSCLRKFVKWDMLGYHVIGDAASVEEAIRVMENNRVDVVLTDIVMPDINGIELIRRIEGENSGVKTVILSGYGEFHYAQEALKLGVMDYLTKPVKFNELEKIFNKIRDLLEKEEFEKRKQDEYVTLIREKFLNDLSKGFFNSQEDISRKAQEVNLELADEAFCLVRVLAESVPFQNGNQVSEEAYTKCKSEAAGILLDILNTAGRNYVFNNDIREISSIFYPHDDASKDAALESLKEKLAHISGVKCHIGVGRSYKHLIDIPHSYREAGKALEYRIIKKEALILDYNEISKFFVGRSLISGEAEEAILYSMTQTDETGLKQYVGRLLEGLHSEKQNEGIYYDVCIEIFIIVNKYLSSYIEDYEDLEKDDRFSIKALLRRENSHDVESFMMDYIDACMGLIKRGKVKTESNIIDNVKMYIAEHYNEEITLNKLSSLVYVHPIYLCTLFKDKTGENFLDYLTNVRMEKAKKLLKNMSLKNL